MHAVLRRRRLPIWIVALSLLWQLLLPWSQARSATGELVPVCTTTGLQWIALHDAPASQGQSDRDQHCALCWLGHEGPGLHDARGAPTHTVAITRAARATPAIRPAGSEPGVPPPIRAPPFRS
ncbi:MAG: hypothetical protein DIU74_004385 [Pseudomonadota bacterium]